MAQLRDLLVNGSARVVGDLYADLSGNVLNYGYCTTAAGTAAKVVNTTGSFNLIDGSKILVLFQYSNTANSPTLNVNNTGAKAIFVDESNGIPKNFIVGQQYYWFVYNAAKGHWRVAGGGTTQITAIEYGGTNNDGFTSNRPLFFNGTKIIGSTDNYINDTSLAINKESITSGYNFEVNGKSLFDDSIYLAAKKTIYKHIGAADTTPMIQVNSNNFDVSILKIDGNNPTTYRDSQSYGYNLKYIGTGGGAQNRLDLIADNMGGTDVTAISVTNSGQVAIGTTGNANYRLHVDGDTYFLNGKSYFGLGNTDQKYYIDTANNDTTSGNAELRNVNVHTLGIRSHPGAGEGISLQGGYNSTGFADFGIAHADAGNGGRYGDVQGDWATYFTIKRESKPQRGWIWRGDNADTVATMAASLSNRGVFTTRAVAADNTYIVFPEGGTATYSDSSKAGMLIIKLPQSKTNTMLRFDVQIYTYERGKKTLATYHVGGYNYTSTNIWEHAQAYSEGIGNLSNLTVRFGRDDSNNVYVTIGETTTIWSYPKVVITNLIVGHSNATVEKWAYGWQVSIANSSPLTSTIFIFDEPNLQTEFSGMNLLPNTQYMEGWSGTNYTGLDLPEKYCRGKQVSLAGSSTSTNYKDISYTDAFTPEPNTWYTLSFWVKSNLSGDILTYFHPQAIYEGYNSNGKITTATDGAITFTLAENTWKRCWVSWKTSSNVSGEKSIILARVYEVANAKIVTVCLPKIEKGRIPTAWTRNPADVVHLFGSGGDSGYIQSGGGFVNDENNLILHGNLSNGTSGIVFTAQHGNINTVLDTNNNFNITDRAFIQYHPHGVTFGNEGNEITSKTTGETGAFIIGIGDNSSPATQNDENKEDIIYLQAPGDFGVKHLKGNNAYTIADTNNTNWHTSWNNGTTAGPTLNLIMAGIVKTTPAIPKASSSISGIVTTNAQTFGGDKTFTGHILANANSSKDIGSSSKTFRNVYATTYYGALQHSVTFERNSVTQGSFDNSADVSYNFGSVVQDLTGAAAGGGATLNADTFAGMTKQQWLNTVYPIGSIYMSVNSTSPATLFGGTWESLGGRFLIGQNETYAAGTTGGSTTHTHTIAHTHTVKHSHTMAHTHTVAHSHGMAHTHPQVATTSGGPSNNTSGGPSNNTSGGPSNNTSGGTSITVAQLPSHTHPYSKPTAVWAQASETTLTTSQLGTTGASANGGYYTDRMKNAAHKSTSATGSGQAHTHNLSSHTHTLSSHTHSLQSHTHTTAATTTGTASKANTDETTPTTSAPNNANTGETTPTTSAASPGTSGSTSTLPPYLAVYMWKRTA